MQFIYLKEFEYIINIKKIKIASKLNFCLENLLNVSCSLPTPLGNAGVMLYMYEIVTHE